MDNAPLREAVEDALRKGESLSAIAIRAGWTREQKGHICGETSRLGRYIGKHPQRNSKGNYTLFTQTTRYDIAVKIIEALGLDPVDFNL